MKKDKINIANAILNLVNSVLWALIAVMNFTDGNDNTSGAVYIGLSIVFFSLSIFYFIKYRTKKK